MTDLLCDDAGPETLWTTNNVSEVLPGVVTPLTWTLWSTAMERGTRRAYANLGILRTDELSIPQRVDDRFTGVFFGRAALNVDTIRMIAARTPGTSASAAEEQLLGSVRPGVPEPAAPSRRVRTGAKVPCQVAAAPRRTRAFLAEQRAWWQREAGAPLTYDAARSLLRDAVRRLETAQWHHAISSMIAIGCLDRLRALAASVGRHDLHPRLTTGLGALEEQRFIAAVWDLSRGRADIRSVAAEFGFHGPGELSLSSYRLEPALLERIAERYRGRREDTAPERVALRQAEVRASAEAELLATLSRARRPAARILLRFSASYVPLRETSKAGSVMAIDGARAAAVRLGDALAAEGLLEHPAHVYCLTVDELLQPPRDCRALASGRMTEREAYVRLQLPVSWSGKPDARPAASHRADADRLLLTGIGVFPGVVEGSARVATNLDDATLAEPGDVLVCHTTDPSWASVFPLAAGLAIDVGSHVSHGALVARELGIPCVINTRTGSEVIRTGDRVRLDGEAGTIELVEAHR